MRRLAFDVPGLNNDLNEELDRHVQAAMADEEALVYAFGERWGPEPNTKDKIFGFKPGNGIHDIHMNQGNDPSFASQDGVWQDGALLIHFPSEQRWVGVFLKFQSQTWHTAEGTGHRIEPTPVPPGRPEVPVEPDGIGAGEPDLVVRIVAALVNPVGPAPERETVTLLNTSPAPIDLNGWTIADRLKNKQRLNGTLPAGGVVVVRVAVPVQLGNQGGIVTLLDASGLKVHGVAYTRQQAQREGWTIAF
jgi:hypothetical protein